MLDPRRYLFDCLVPLRIGERKVRLSFDDGPAEKLKMSLLFPRIELRRLRVGSTHRFDVADAGFVSLEGCPELSSYNTSIQPQSP